MADQIKLSILIVDYNTHQLLLECIKSLKEHPLPFNYEIIIVDNASSESHLDEYAKIDPTIKTFRLNENKGFGAGNNFAAQYASGDYLLLLNPDTLIIDQSIAKMATFIETHQEIGALTCLLYGEDRKTLQQNFFGRFQSLASVTLRRHNHRKIDPALEFFYTDIITAAALMIKREHFVQLGGFDEGYFMYLEDDDLCRRLVSAGYKNAVLNTAKIIHLEGKSSTSKQKKRFYYQSQNRYWQKHNGFIATLAMRVLRFPYKLIKTL